MRQAFFVALIVVAACGILMWRTSRSLSILYRWVNENGLELLSREERWVMRGPFFWFTGNGQVVYHVRVRDREGRERSAWVRRGGWFFGLLSDHADVQWDEDSP